MVFEVSVWLRNALKEQILEYIQMYAFLVDQTQRRLLLAGAHWDEMASK